MQYVNLEQIADILNGYNFKSSNYVNHGVRVIRITNVQQGYLEDKDPVFYEYTKDLDKYMLKENDLLMSLTGNVGRVGMLVPSLLPAGLNQRVACIRCKNDNFNIKFLFYFFNNELFRKNAVSNSNGVAQLNLSTEWLKKVKIPAYDENKQYKIVEEIDNIVDLIDNTKKHLTNLDNIVKSQFIEMFDESDFPIRKIEEVCSLKSGTTFDKSSELEFGDILYCKVSDMNLEGNEKFMIRSKTYVSNEVGLKSSIPAYSTIFPKRGGAIGTNKKRLLIKDTCVDLNTMGVTPSNKINPEYLYQYFQNLDLGSLCDGSTIPQLNNKNIGPLSIKVPPIELQNKFADFVQQIDKSKFIIHKQIKLLEELLDKKMHEYFGD